jgi:hypothetical protein
VSPWTFRLQEFLLAPMWDRVHPLYLRLFGNQSGEASTQPGSDADIPASTREPTADAIDPIRALDMVGQEKPS